MYAYVYLIGDADVALVSRVVSNQSGNVIEVRITIDGTTITNSHSFASDGADSTKDTSSSGLAISSGFQAGLIEMRNSSGTSVTPYLAQLAVRNRRTTTDIGTVVVT